MPIENENLLKQIPSFRKISETEPGVTVIELNGVLGAVVAIEGKDLKVEIKQNEKDK